MVFYTINSQQMHKHRVTSNPSHASLSRILSPTLPVQGICVSELQTPSSCPSQVPAAPPERGPVSHPNCAVHSKQQNPLAPTAGPPHRHRSPRETPAGDGHGTGLQEPVVPDRRAPGRILSAVRGCSGWGSPGTGGPAEPRRCSVTALTQRNPGGQRRAVPLPHRPR